MIVPSRVVPPIALLVALLTVTILYDAGIASAPRHFFGAGDDVVLLLPSTGPVTSSGRVPSALADVLRTREDAQLVSPEVMVMTAIGGRSVFARGVDATVFLVVEEGRLTAGRMPEALGEALVGQGLARLLDVEPGDRLTMVGSLVATAALVEVVGVFEADGLARDEVLLSLPVARGLAGLGTDSVHLIRVKTSDVDNITRLATTVQPLFTYSGVRLSADVILEGQQLTLVGNVTNWGLVGGAKEAKVTTAGQVVGERVVFVPPRETVAFQIPLTLPGPGNFTLSLNPTFEVEVRAARAQFEGVPSALAEGVPVDIRLVDAEGPLEGAEVRAAGVVALTDEDGVATLVPRLLGPSPLTAWKDGDLLAQADVFVARPEDVDRAVGEVRRIDVDRPLVGVNDSVHVNVTLVGVGGARGEVPLNVTLDGIPFWSRLVTIAPGESLRVEVVLGTLAPGKHTVGAPGLRTEETIESFPGDPAVEIALRAREAARANPELAPRVGTDATRYVDRIVKNVALAATALSLAAAGLASLALLAVWSRHLAERAPAIGVLKALGARREQVQAIVLRATVRYAAIAAAVGLALGGLVVVLLHATGFVRAFGHRIPPAASLWLVVVVAVVAIFVNGAIARTMAGRIYDNRVEALLGQHLLRPPPRHEPTLRDTLAEEAS